MLATKTKPIARNVAYRTRGFTHGPITRLVSPSDLGEAIKPFVFLDRAVFDADSERAPMERLWHPHSGIATVTVMFDGGIRFAETTGKSGVVAKGGVEFMRASGGVWHTGQAEPGLTKLFQLWIALPPALENAANASRYVTPDEVPVVGPARVILGSLGGKTSPIDAPPMTYLQVELADGEAWSYTPREGEGVAWLAVMDGAVHAASAGEVAIFEPSEQPIDLVADGPTRFVFGAATPHPYDLVLGNYSVHTSAEALRTGEEEIRRIGRQLRADGIIGRR